VCLRVPEHETSGLDQRQKGELTSIASGSTVMRTPNVIADPRLIVLIDKAAHAGRNGTMKVEIRCRCARERYGEGYGVKFN
jgi:hypothetical protein